MSPRIKLTVQGASGRAAGELLKVLSDYPHFELAYALVSPSSKRLGETALGAIKFTADKAEAVKNSAAVIDFSEPVASLDLAKLCAQFKRPLLIATTGHSEEQLSKISACSKESAILLAPNTSLGVFAMHELGSLAKRILGDGFEIEIFEMHHSKKKDAPSGTALSLANHLATLEPADGAAAMRSEIGVSSARGGDVVGEHTVFFLGSGERIEITHRATNRAIFGRGALKLTERLLECPPGLYRVRDIWANPK